MQARIDVESYHARVAVIYGLPITIDQPLPVQTSRTLGPLRQVADSQIKQTMARRREGLIVFGQAWLGPGQDQGAGSCATSLTFGDGCRRVDVHGLSI
jgi:hypothetical protein